MSITVETVYRLTIDGTAHDLSEDAARRLVALISERIMPTPPERMRIVTAPAPSPPAPPEPKALAARSLRAQGNATRRESAERVTGAWNAAEVADLRAWIAAGMAATEIARRLRRKPNAVYAKMSTLGISAHHADVPCDPPEAASGDAPVEAAPDEPEPDHDEPRQAWTAAETRALIHAMSAPGGGIKAAMSATGHDYLSCYRRWTHLKQAGILTVAQYRASQERTVETTA